MSQSVTVDASVFVNAFSPTEEGSDNSAQYINHLRQAGIPVIVPSLLLPEIAASIARKQGKPDQALRLTKDVRQLPGLTLIDVDESLANLAVDIAANHRLRGSDAVYAAVALRFGTQLITLDKEQLERLPKVVSVGPPSPKPPA